MDSLFKARQSRRGWLHCSLRAGALLAAGLLGAGPLQAAATPAHSAAPAASAASMVATRDAALPQLLVLGDSLSAEYGLARGTGWVALLSQRLGAKKIAFQVLNASISGETTAGGLARLPALLKAHPRVVVVELGANDALRGLPIAETRKNLDALTVQATSAGARVLLAGIQVPPNYGRQYNADLARTYVDVAAAHHAALVPFLLAGVADRGDAEDWFQADHLHPVAKAHPLILDNVWPALQPLLER